MHRANTIRTADGASDPGRNFDYDTLAPLSLPMAARRSA